MKSNLLFHHDWSSNFTEVYSLDKMGKESCYEPDLSQVLHILRKLGVFKVVVADNIVEFEFKPL